MAGPPVKKRTVRTYVRDIETLERLKASIALFEAGDSAQRAVKGIDMTLSAIRELLPLAKSA